MKKRKCNNKKVASSGDRIIMALTEFRDALRAHGSLAHYLAAHKDGGRHDSRRDGHSPQQRPDHIRG